MTGTSKPRSADWTVIAPAYMQLGRYPDAVKALRESAGKQFDPEVDFLQVSAYRPGAGQVRLVKNGQLQPNAVVAVQTDPDVEPPDRHVHVAAHDGLVGADLRLHDLVDVVGGAVRLGGRRPQDSQALGRDAKTASTKDLARVRIHFLDLIQAWRQP